MSNFGQPLTRGGISFINGTISAGGTVTPGPGLINSSGTLNLVAGAGLAINNGTIVATGTAAAVSSPNFSGSLTLSGSSTAIALTPGTAGDEATSDSFGAIGRYWDAASNLYTAGTVIAGNGFTLTPSGLIGQGFSLGPGGISGLPVASYGTSQVSGLSGLLLVDTYGAVGAVLDAAGSTLPGSTSIPLTYTATDVQRLDALNLAASYAVSRESDFYAQRPVFGYNHVLWGGQSEAEGWQGAPALSTTQPFDNLMVGTSTRPTTTTSWTSQGSNAFSPLVGTNSTSPFRTGMVSNMGTVTISVTNSTSGTITQTGTNSFSTAFAVGDVLQFGSLVAPALADNSGYNGAINQNFTVSAVTATTISYTNTSDFSVTASAATAQPSAFLTIIQGNTGYGETIGEEACNLYRRLELAGQKVTSDSSRQLVSTNVCNLGTPISSLRNGTAGNPAVLMTRATGTTDTLPFTTVSAVTSLVQGTTTFVQGTDYTVSGGTITWINPPTTGSQYVASFTTTHPTFFAMATGAAGVIKSNATAAAKTSGLFVAHILQGGTDAQAIGGTYPAATTYASYVTDFSGWITDINTQVAQGIYGQASPPLFLVSQLGGYNTSDVGFPQTIQQAQLDVCLNPPLSTVYMVGGSYAPPRQGVHWSANGYRWWGAQVAKVMYRIIERGERWLPLYMTGATYRNNVILASFHVPVPPLQFQQVFAKLTPTMFSDYGFTVRDASGNVVPIRSVSLVGQTVVQIVCSKSLSVGTTVGYGDYTYHNGQGNLCDSDPVLADVAYSYTAGSGQLPAENVPAWVGRYFPLWNWCCIGSVTATNG